MGYFTTYLLFGCSGKEELRSKYKWRCGVLLRFSFYLGFSISYGISFKVEEYNKLIAFDDMYISVLILI